MVLTVRTKLILLIVIPLVATLIIGFLAVTSLSRVSGTAAHLTEQRLVPVLLLEKIARQYTHNLVDVAHKTRAQMMFWQEADKALATAKQDLESQWSLYLSHGLSPEEQAVLDAHPNAVAQASQAIEKVVGFVAERSSYGMGNYIDLELYQDVEPVLALIAELEVVQEQLAKQAGAEAQAVAGKSARQLMWVAALMMVTLMIFGWWLNVGINGRMQRLLSVITDIEQNKDLSIRVELPSGDEFGDMGRRFDRMMSEIGSLMAQMQSMGRSMIAAADDLVDDNERSTAQAQAQSREIEQMVREMEQVKESVNVILANVDAAAEISQQTQQRAQTGNQTVLDTVTAINHVASVVRETADGMESVKRDSDNIGTVLEVIKSIAEQTNLLALNAAIEAARAGEQGRGFAVVADEVRQLASRTALSTQEIQDIISNLQQGASAASRDMIKGAEATTSAVTQAQAAGNSLASIVQGIHTIGETSQQIHQASDEQQQVVERVAVNVERIDGLARQCAEYSSNALSSGQSLADIGRQLGDTLSVFKV